MIRVTLDGMDFWYWSEGILYPCDQFTHDEAVAKYMADWRDPIDTGFATGPDAVGHVREPSSLRIRALIRKDFQEFLPGGENAGDI